MTTTLSLADLTAAALKLSASDRAALADAVLDSLPPDDDPSSDEADYEPEYAAELQRRIDEVRSGTADLMSVEEAMRHIMSDDDADR